MTRTTYALAHAIVLTTKNAASGDNSDEVLKSAGFVVEMRRPKARDLRLLDTYDGKAVAGALAMIAALSNLDGIECDNLDAHDFGELGNLLERLDPSGPATGATA